MSLHPDDPIGLAWQPITTADIPEVTRLLNDIADTDDLPERFDDETVADELDDEGVDAACDTLLGRDQTGQVVAFSFVTELPGSHQRRVQLWGGVAPTHRRRGIGTALFDFQRRRAAQLVMIRQRADPDLVNRPLLISVDYRDGDQAREQLITTSGFIPIRRFYLMERQLGPRVTDPVARRAVVEGISIVPWETVHDEAVRQLHNHAFAEHFFSEPRSEAFWATWTTGHRSFRRDWSFVATHGDQVVGYLGAHAHEMDWAALGYPQGWINLLGVRDDRRGRGIGSALIEATCAAMNQAGMATAGLEVDTDNSTGALDLYRQLGFATQQCFIKAAEPA